uniref:protein disulfide-isomerase n=1 Tax=Lepeophtheirus salmonis TaxID=72036 RepID=A0A0K2SVX8_LEPSM
MNAKFATQVLLCALFAPGLNAGFYSKKSGVVDLNKGNFDSRVTDSDGVALVEFYAPWCGHCQKLVPEYEKAGKALKGLITVGAVNCDEEKALCSQFGVNGFPTIKVFADNKKSPEAYNGDRTAQGFVRAAQNAAQKVVSSRLGGGGGGGGSGGGRKKKEGGNGVVELTDSNFKKEVLDSDDMWLVEFFAPWCGHCKNLEPHWKSAASELKGKVKLGAVDATVYPGLAQQYGVQGYPTIKYFPSGLKRDGPEEFDGGRTKEDIVAWALERFELNLPAPDVLQIVGESQIKEHCESKPLCVISFLPHILDCQSECRNSYIKILKETGNKFKKLGWGWLWAEATAQSDLESAMDVGGFGYPAMTVLSAKKMKYSMLTGSFGKDGIHEFLRDLSYGKGRTNAVRGAKLPSIKKTEPWDGKDAEFIPEEEIDLSDVELEPLEKEEL